MAAIWNLLRDIDKELDLHLQAEEAVQPKLNELITILERSKGVMVLLRFVLYLGAPLFAVVYWIKDHVKL